MWTVQIAVLQNVFQKIQHLPATIQLVAFHDWGGYILYILSKDIKLQECIAPKEPNLGIETMAANI